MHDLAYTAETKSRIDRLDGSVKRQLKEAIERIAREPAIGKRLSHELSGFLSYASGRYRVIYKVSDSPAVMTVHTVGPRRNVYEKFSRRFS